MVPCWHTGGLTTRQNKADTECTTTIHSRNNTSNHIGNTMQGTALHNLLELASFEVAKVLTTIM